VVAGGIAIAPGVALADPPNVQITNLPTDVVSGGTLTMQYTVAPANDNGGGGRTIANIRIQSDFRCSGQCSGITQVDNGGTTFTARLTAPSVNPGQTRNVNITITATILNESASANQSVAVKGPDRPQNVTQISGKVKDQDGKAISGASVAMKDSAGNAYSATTNGSGGYSFNSSDNKPIVPGNISVGALKDGYETATVQIQAAAGRSVNVPLTLKLVEAAASPSATASASAEALPSDEATEEPSAAVAPPDPATKAASDSSGGGSLLFIVLGGLLVAAGVGAIVLVVMRRKNNGDDGLGGPDDPTVMGGGAGLVPPSQGRFNDATRVAAPMGAGRDATMVAPRTGGAGSLSDAPTMLQRPVPADDEFPDPYGAPIPQQGGAYRGAPAGGWDGQGNGYGAGGSQYGGGAAYAEPTQYGRPPEDDGYGAGSYTARGTGYAAGQGRYNEPTGMYRPEAEQDDGYGYDRGGYGAGGTQYSGAAGGGGYDQGGYDRGGYEQQPAGYDRGGYGQDAGNGYGTQSGGAYSGGAYGTAPQQPQYGAGYDDPGYGDQGGGYDQRGGSYGRGGGYDQAGGYDDPSYGDQGGYGPQQQRGGGYGGQSRQQEASHPGQRRSLDWMDN
jgi:hypothetical protein